MANRKTSEEIRKASEQQQKERKYASAMKTQRPLTLIALGLMVMALLFYFVTWADVYNTAIPGPEVGFNGWNSALMAITRDYMSFDSIYGDLAVPFYYYATSYVESLTLYTLISLIGAVVAIVVLIVAAAKKLYQLHGVAMVLSVVSTVCLFMTFGTALSMSNADILSIYCGGNPACSIRSFAIEPALMMLCVAVVEVIAFVKYMQARQLLK